MNDFWQGRRVLVTGHTGFKGSWLTLWLEAMGAEVTGFALPAEGDKSLFASAQVGAEIESVTGDLREPSGIAEVVRRQRPEIVLHLAGQSIVRRSYREPAATFASNVMGTAHLLDAVRAVDSVGAVVVVTSDKCYESQEWDWGYRETDPLGGHDPYSTSKACAELVTTAYRRSFLDEQGIAVATARAGNVIGGGDWSDDRLIPDIVRAFAVGTPAPIRNPHAVRPWQHVLDCLHGYLLLAEKLFGEGIVSDREWCTAWNFGPADGDTAPVCEIADVLSGTWLDGPGWEATPDANAPHETALLRLDSSRAERRLGWRRVLTLRDALEWTASWYRDESQGDDPRTLTLEQITRYTPRTPWRLAHTTVSPLRIVTT